MDDYDLWILNTDNTDNTDNNNDYNVMNMMNMMKMMKVMNVMNMIPPAADASVKTDGPMRRCTDACIDFNGGLQRMTGWVAD